MRNKLAKRLFSMALSGLLAFNIVPVGPLAPLTAWADPIPGYDVPDVSKDLVDNGDGTYTLSLSVDGTAKSVTEPTKANVLVIYDTSGSMFRYTPDDLGMWGRTSATSQPNAYPEARVTLYTADKEQITADGFVGDVYAYSTDNSSTSQSYSDSGSYFRKYIGQRYCNDRRADVSRETLENAAETLFGFNTPEYPDTVQMALVSFNTTASKHPMSGTDNWTTDKTTYASKIPNPKKNAATNWQHALELAKEVLDERKAAETADGGTMDPTYVVFLTDGNPSRYDTAEGHGKGGTGYDTDENNVKASYEAAEDNAKAISGQGYTIYNIGIYGSVTRMQNLTTLMNDNGGTASYYPADDTAAVQAAFRSIVSEISTALSTGGVTVTDGITSGVTSSTVVSGDVSGYTYTVKDNFGTIYEVTVDENDVPTFKIGTETGTGTKTTKSYTDPSGATKTATVYSYTTTVGSGADAREHTYYMVPASVASDGTLTWDLSPLEGLTPVITKDGASVNDAEYTVSFTVWPNQDAYDLVAKLNNGLITPAEAEAQYPDIYPNLEKQGNTYYARTNTDQYVDYYIVQTNPDGSIEYIGPGQVQMDPPEPMNLSKTDLLIEKTWMSSMDEEQLNKVLAKKPVVHLELYQDSTLYTTFDVGGVDHYPADEWKASCSIAPGVMLSDTLVAKYHINTTGKTSVTYEGKTYYILESGHDYKIEENPNPDYHFELVDHIYHPMVVDGTTMDVTIENGVVTSMENMASLVAENVLRGGVQLKKVVTGTGAPADAVFAFQAHILNADGTPYKNAGLPADDQLWFSYYADESATDPIRSAMIEDGDYVTIKAGQVFRIGSVRAGVKYDFTELTASRALTGMIHTETDDLSSYSFEYPASFTYSGVKYTHIGYDESGTPTETEDPVGEDHVVDPNVSSNVVFTNNFETVNIKAKKEWKNADGTTTPPEGAKVTFQLLADGEEVDGKIVELDGTVDTNGEDPAWTANFKDLPKYEYNDAGTQVEINYTVSETITYNGYKPDPETPVEDGGVIINTEEVTTVSAKKAWENPDGTTTPPTDDATVKFTLYQNGTKLTDAKYTVTLDGTADGDAPTVSGGYESESWTATFVELPKTDSSGKDYVYTIAESEGYKGYTASTLEPVADGETITNKKGDNKKDVFIGTSTESVDGKVVAVGTILTYKIDYINNNSKGEKADVTIRDQIPTNTEYVEASATQPVTVSGDVLIWEIKDVPAGQGGQVSFQVKVKDSAAGKILENHAIVNDGENEDETNYVYNSVPKKEVFDATAAAETEINGKKVKVGDILTYKVSYELKDEDPKTEYTDIVITDVVPEGTEYVDGSATTDPYFFTIDGKNLTWTIDSQAQGSYSVSFKVKVTADAVELGEVENTATLNIGPNGSDVKTNPVTNPVLTSVKVSKIWDDENNSAGIRPASVTVRLLADGTEIDHATLDGSNEWTYLFEGLNKTTDAGAEIKYTVTEDAVANYSTTIEGPKDDEETGGMAFTVTNKHRENGKSVYTGSVQTNIDGNPVGVGQILTYQIDYVNNRSEKADIEITDTIPQYTEYVDGSASDGGSYSGGKVTWTIADVEPGEGGSVTFQVEVQDAAAGMEIKNQSVVFDGENTNTTNEVVNHVPKKDVLDESGASIDKQKVKVGDVLTYTITYEIEKDAESGTVTDIVPTGTEFVDADNDGALVGDTVTWTLSGDFLTAGKHTVSFRVRVTPDAVKKGIIENEGVVEIGEDDPATTNKVTNPVLVNIRVVKVWDDDDNKDNKRPSNVTVYLFQNDSEIGSHTLGSGNNWAYNWRDQDAADADGNPYTYNVTEDAVPEYSTVITEEVVDEVGDTYYGWKVFTVTNTHKQTKKEVTWGTVSYDLDGYPASPGEILTYTLYWANNSTQTADITVKDIIPDFTTFVPGSASDDGVFADNAVTWNFKEQKPGASGTVTFQVQIESDKAGVLIENDGVVIVGDTESSTNKVYTPVPEKEVRDETGKDINHTGVAVGDILTYVVSYELLDAKDEVIVTDIVPTGTEYVDGSADNGGTFADGKITWDLKNQKAGKYSVSFKVKVTVDALNLVQIDNDATLKIGPDGPEARTNVVTNYPETSVTVVKVWNDNDYEGRPDSVTVTLTAEPDVKISGAEQVLSEANNWTYTWNKLPAKTDAGKISYTVTEAAVKDYSTTYATETNQETGIVTWTVTNKHEEDKKDVFVNSVDVSVDGKPVGVGDELTYVITYVNNTNETGTVTIEDTYPANTTFVEASDGGQESGGTVKWSISDVPAGGTGTVSFKVTVDDPAAGTTLENKAIVSDGTNTHETNVVTNPVPKKEVFDENNVAIDGKGVKVGDILTYVVSFSLAQDAEDDVFVTDVIPTGTEFVSAENDGALDGGKVEWNLGRLTAGDYSVSFKVRVTKAALEIDEIRNTGILKIGPNGPEVKTNPVVNPVLTSVIVEKVWNDGEYAERPTEVTITLMADGATASDATKEPTVKLNDGNNWTYTWTGLPAAKTQAGATAAAKIVYTVTEEAVPKYSTTIAYATAEDTGIITGTVTNKHEENEKTVFTGGTTTKIDGKVVEAGQQLDYSIKYVNNTSGEATVTVTDKIPDYTTLVDGSISDGGTESGGTITWTITNVAAGASGTVTFSVKVNDDGTADGQILENTSIVNDGENEYDTNTVTNTVPKKEVQDEAGNDINHAQVQVGDILTYVVSYTLAEDADDVKVTDVVPTGTKFVSAEDGGTESGGTVTWNLGTQTAGEQSVSFKVEVTEDALKLTAEGKSIENEAELQIGEDDPIVTNKVYNNVPEKEVKNSEGSDADKEAVKVGDILTYDLNYVLTADADYVKVSDVIPAGTEYVDGSMNPADGTFDGSQVIWEYAGLPAGSYDYHFQVRVTTAALELDEINNTYKIKVGEDGPEKESNPVTNPVNTEVHVQKKWVKGEDEYHQPKEPASVNVTLMADGATASDAHKPGINPTITLDAGSKWTGFWDDLKSVIGGKKVEYSVVETPVPGSYEVEYSSATDSDAEVDTGAATWTVTNDYKAKGEIRLEAEKKLTGREWLEGESYTFQLFDADGETLLDEQVATAENPKVTFKPISYTQDDINSDGYGSFVYEIREVKDQSVDPYWYVTFDEHTSYAAVTLEDAGNGVITASVEYDGDPVFRNEYQNTEYTVVKKWDDADNRLEIRPEAITITVYGMVSGDTVYTEDVTLTKDNNWLMTLTGLPKMYMDQEIYYFADETTEVEGYTKATSSNASPSDAEEGEEVDRSTLIVNTTDTGDLSIKKFVNKATEEFDKTDTADYQFTVTVENGHFEDITKDVIFYVAKQNSKDGEKTGTVTFQGGKAKFTLHSDEILRIVGLPAGAAYTVEESVDAATHYDPVIYNNEGIIIKGKTQYVSYINRELDKTLITIEKKWEDGDDRDGFRPNQILVDVFKIQGGEEKLIEEDLKLTAENSWIAKLNPNGYNAVATISEASKSSANASASEAYREQASASVATASANSASFSDAEVADAFDEDGNLLDGTIFDDLFSAVKEAVTDVAGKIGTLFGIDDGTKISYRVEEKEIPKYYDVTYDDCEATQNDDGSWSFTLNFTNTHELMPPVWIDPPVKKIVTVIRGTISTPETFNFRMIGLDGTTAFPKGATVYKDADGNYYVQLSITGEGSKEFGKIEYTKVGTYKYRVYEIAGNAQYYTYTTDYYDITVVVKEEGGALVETVTVKKNGTETVYNVTTRDGVKGEKLGIQFVNKYDRTTGGGGNPPGGGGNPPGRRTPPPADPGTPVIPEAPVPGALPKTGEPAGKAVPMLFAMLAMFGALFGFRKRDDEDEQ